MFSSRKWGAERARRAEGGEGRGGIERAGPCGPRGRTWAFVPSEVGVLEGSEQRSVPDSGAHGHPLVTVGGTGCGSDGPRPERPRQGCPGDRRWGWTSEGRGVGREQILQEGPRELLGLEVG